MEEKNSSSSFSTFYSLLSWVITFGNLAVNLKWVGVFLHQFLTINVLGVLYKEESISTKSNTGEW